MDYQFFLGMGLHSREQGSNIKTENEHQFLVNSNYHMAIKWIKWWQTRLYMLDWNYHSKEAESNKTNHNKACLNPQKK